jgi:hypothetical protein
MDPKSTQRHARLYGVAVADCFISQLDVMESGFSKPTLRLKELIAKEKEQAWRLSIDGDATSVDQLSWHHRPGDHRQVRFRTELTKYDGFVITHTPVFARFHENFGEPVILINSCRYDQPFCCMAETEHAARPQGRSSRIHRPWLKFRAC